MWCIQYQVRPIYHKLLYVNVGCQKSYHYLENRLYGIAPYPVVFLKLHLGGITLHILHHVHRYFSSSWNKRVDNIYCKIAVFYQLTKTFFIISFQMQPQKDKKGKMRTVLTSFIMFFGTVYVIVCWTMWCLEEPCGVWRLEACFGTVHVIVCRTIWCLEARGLFWNSLRYSVPNCVMLGGTVWYLEAWGRL